ncbi:hypothetical protein ACT1U9_21000 [Streptomyces sp. BR1]|uniref:hypothetical protein n=1 Tax=Streptomyces sp. BR1 TaxID=1592323 RepID=UPI00402BA03F
MSDSLLPYAVGAAKRARRAAVRMRRRVEQMHTVPAIDGVKPRPLLQAVHFSVSGGRTLNFAVAFPRRPEAISAAHLEFSRGRRVVHVDLEQEPQSDGTLLLTATSPLRHDDPSETAVRGPLLSTGTWRMEVVVTGSDGRELRAKISSAPSASSDSLDGPTLSTSPSPTSGAVFRPVRSVDGRSMLSVRGPRHHAELTSFELRWDRVVVHGRLIAGRAPVSEYAAEAVLRRSSKSVTAPVEWDGDRFTFDVPLAEMSQGRTTRTWDMHLKTGGNRLKITRRLTDVRYPKQVYRTPFRIVALDNGALARVHAYVTPAGVFAVSCTGFGTAPRGAEEVA